ncbi:hypothetical protein [Pedobacter jeongneungensis]|uniref:hypothetical protein n=1 Tax=Pedobacter jeongneungensis TaxID=947309 RepID=UPI00046AED28|nr:hypothetical protein [Pedobacter jeongneungensis]
MIELTYLFRQEFNKDQSYQLMRASMEDPWLVLSGSDVMGIIDEVKGEWLQIVGEGIPQAAVEAMGELIRKQQFSWLPRLISKQWPDYVMEVIVKSKNRYEVICHAEACIKLFKQRFTPGIHALAKREEEIVFKVSSFNTSNFYEITKRPAIDRYV